MSMLMYKDMFIEELDRKQRAKEAMTEALYNRFFYSRVFVKKINGKEYLYGYSVKEHKDVYIGPASDELKEECQKLVENHKMVKEQIKSVDEDIPKIKKIIKYL